MFNLAFLIGIYSFLFFFLGILSLLKKEIILSVTTVYLLFIFLIFKKNFYSFFRSKYKLCTYRHSERGQKPSAGILITFLIVLIIIQVLINLVGALGPELGFDALWYHLTMPKTYLSEGKIFYIGGHLYYSAMPQLTEMYYLAALALGNGITAKLIHFTFGLLSLIAIYKMARLFFKPRDAILAALIFYSNLVVGWMSITAYIDLSRTFFETMALWAFLIFTKSNQLRWVFISAAMVGFAISSKLISFNSVMVYIIMLSYLRFFGDLKFLLKISAIYIIIPFVIVLPWLIYSYSYTGNPIYPIFSPGYNPVTSLTSYGFQNVPKLILDIFLFAPDPISPVYFISLPLIFLYFSRIYFQKLPEISLTINLLIIYILFNIPPLFLHAIESSGRFILPYLPAFTLLFMLLLKNLKSKFLYNLLLVTIIIIALSSIAYRGIANKRFIPYLLGQTTLPEFMKKNMEFQVGNFYDIDGYFQKTIGPKDMVLIYGISNLYYVNFPYIHWSSLKPKDMYNYILVKEGAILETYNGWRLIYQNPISKVKLYSILK